MRSVPLLLLALVLGPGSAAGAEAIRPNILLLVAEDMSARVGAFGDAVAVTPHLDRLAAEGIRYPNAFTASGVCAPSRAALITGVHPNRLGAQHMRSSDFRPAPGQPGPSGYTAVPPPEVKAFPELLRAAGWFTSNNAKLDYQFSGALPGSGPFTIWDADGWRTDWRDHPDDRPWFAMQNFLVTHESGLFPVQIPRNLTQALMLLMRIGSWFPPQVVETQAVTVPPYYPDTPTVRATLARHYANVALMDARVGEILEQLDASGEAERTIVVWTTDHGDGLPRAKRELYDSGIRVPLIVRWPEALRPPGAAPGRVDERLVSFVDLAPTILAMAGLETPDWMDGRVFAGRTAAPPREFVFAARDRIDTVADRGRAVRDARFKYIRNERRDAPAAHRSDFRENLEMMAELRRLFEAGRLDPVQSAWFETPRPGEELFDTRADPDEVVNLARDPAHAATKARLRAALDAWLASQGDAEATPEAELAARFWPDGVQPTTATPSLAFSPGEGDAAQATLACPTEGASIGYRVDGDGGPSDWRLYTGPFTVPTGARVEAKAVRYGWEESRVAAARSP